MNERTQKGLLTELYCEQAFTELGIMLSVPIMNDSRYDFIADINNNFIKIQCKTCSYEEKRNVIFIPTRSMRSNSQGVYERKYNKEEIDYFYTYYNNVSYLIPVEECNSGKTLHLNDTTLNGATKNINFAKDYELKKVLKDNFSFEVKNNFSYTNIKPIENYCIDCGAPITKDAIRCRICSGKAKITEKQVTREELKQLIRDTPFTTIGKRYDVKDNTIRKWCDFYKLPRTKKEINKYTDEEWEKI